MNDGTWFEIGADARCLDEACGKLRRVVVDPAARAVTHLVVEAEHRSGLGKLVPVGLVDSADPAIVLHCSRAEFEKLEAADETQLVPGTSGGYGTIGQLPEFPYYGTGLARMSVIDGLGGNSGVPVVHDLVPLGEMEMRRGDRVHATDGDVGRVHGLVVDPRTHQVTHVLLGEGHLWGSKEVAIPISAVEDMTEGIKLTIARDEVRDLSPVALDHDDPRSGRGSSD